MARAATHPIHECLINADWQRSSLATVLVSRKRPKGTLAASVFLVDLGCLGVKNAIAKTTVSPTEYGDLRARITSERRYVQCTPELAARVVQQAFRYAQDLGFQPHRDYWAARPILTGITPDEEAPVVCGSGGRPVYVAGPHDDVPAIMSQLEQRLGSDGFQYIVNLN